MPVSVTMPRLGESVTEGTVTRWLKQVGDTVEADEPLLEVSTDKVDTEIPSPASGVLSKIVVNEDETADVGSELAVISESAGDGGEGGEGQAEQGRAGSGQPAEAEPAGAEPGGEPTGEPTEQRAEPARAEAGPERSEDEAAQPAGQERGGEAGGQAPTADAGSPSGESTVVKMPALGESVTEGTVTRWLKQVGDTVEADEPLLEVSTDKVDTEIPAPAGGTLLEIRAGEDETVAVGADLAVIGVAGADAAAGQQAGPAGQAAEQAAPERAEQAQRAEREQPAAQDAESTAAVSTEREEPVPAPRPEPPAQAPRRPAPAPQQPAPAREAAPSRAQTAQADGAEVGYVTPLVRKLATEHGVDLSRLSGTGVGGRIRKQDVLEAAERAKAAEARPAPQAAPAGRAPAPVEPSPLRGKTEKMSRTRTLIATRMVESLQTSAQLTTVVEVDVTRIARLRDRAKAEFQRRHGVKLSFLPFLAMATVEALRAHPKVNASIDMEARTVTYHDGEHLGVAVDTERGLMVPVIRDAGDLNLSGLAKRIADLAERTRTNKVTPDELSGGTFTLTNTGSRGALFDTPIINQPQVGILGTGAVVKRAVVLDDPDLGEAIVPRSMMYLALSYDHRLVDGADAARFLTTMKERLEGGAFEAELGLG